MTEEEGHDQESAENICGALEQESKSDHGDADALLDALDRGRGLIADVGVDLVSGVDVPAVDSKWVMTKSGGARKGHDFRAASPILLSKADDDADQRIAYAAAMIPREPDKEGDVVATPTVEQAAHDFLKQDGGVDTDHSLIDGEGEVVESWVLKQERTFDLPGGETETYGAGTWMVGIEWGKEAWERIKNGELTGLSIYGMAEHVPLARAASCAECGASLSATKSQNADTHKGESTESNGMGSEPTNDGDGAGDAGDGGGSDGPTIGEVAASVDSLADTVADVTETVESVKEAVETEKQDANEAAALLGDEYDLPPGDVLDVMEAAQDADADAVLEAIESIEPDGSVEQDADVEGKEDDEDEDEDDDEMDKSARERATDAHMAKGSDARQTAAKGIAGDDETSGDGLSYRAIAEQQEADN